MKRIGFLYDKIVSYDNLVQAHKMARRGKHCFRKINGVRVDLVKMVDENPDFYLREIEKMLKNKTYEVSKYHTFQISDKGKTRTIYDLPYFPDRIIQWAAMLILEPIFLRRIIPQSFAAMPDRGQHKASMMLRKYMADKNGAKYCLKLDIKKFFPSISNDLLKEELRRVFKDGDLLWLLDKIIDSGDGLPIGNYTSQYFGNFFLTRLDHYIKERLGVRYYLRYMDDMIILSESKERCAEILQEVCAFVKTLGLEIKRNYQYFPARIRGVDFVGYRHYDNYVLVRARTKRNLHNRLFNGEKVLAAYNGILQWCNSYHLKQNTFGRVLCQKEQVI